LPYMENKSLQINHNQHVPTEKKVRLDVWLGV